MASAADRLLVEAVRAGSNQAYSDLVAEYQNRLNRFIHRWIKDNSTIEDLVQETFWGFITSLPNYDENRDLQKWLFTIAKNKVTDHLRKEGRRPATTGTEEILYEQKATNYLRASSIARNQETRQKEQQLLQRVLSKLIQDWKQKEEWLKLQVMELLFVKGWPNYQVAAELKIADQQVANIRFAAIKKIKDELGTMHGTSIAVLGDGK